MGLPLGRVHEELVPVGGEPGELIEPHDVDVDRVDEVLHRVLNILLFCLFHGMRQLRLSHELEALNTLNGHPP